MLSNAELKPLLLDPHAPLIRNLKIKPDSDDPESALQPSSLDLHVGEIHIPPDDRNGMPDSSRAKYVIPPGGTVVLVTREDMNFPAAYAGLMFPKSARLAECGVLLTNFGRVDPGFHGAVRFAVINMGRDPYEIRIDDAIASLVVFRLQKPASPDWSSSGRAVAADRTLNFVRSLSPRQLALQTVIEESHREATKTVYDSTLVSTLVASVIGTLATGLTLGLTWFAIIAPRLDRYEQAFDAMQRPAISAPAGIVAQPATPPKPVTNP